ncbi:MAG: DUF4402 domain-containing protein [Gammaproteobacteria bacterium]|nr:DUF4402 domain-containing protein [Gammaproteobacteria bacterium]
MKKQSKLFKAGMMTVVAGMIGTTANADVVDGSAVANLVAPLSIVENIPMNFGTLSGGPALGTVILTTAGARTTTGDAEILAIGGGAAGDFTITGDPGRAYTISFSASATISDGGGNTMNVDNFSDTSTGTLPAATETFQVGATLNVGASQPAGAYSTANGGGSAYTITVNYN